MDIQNDIYPHPMHVHEVQGSVLITEPKTPHSHRFATVTGEAIPVGLSNHIHELEFRTDFYDDHFHLFQGRTSGAIPVGDRHVHFLESVTAESEGHKHEFRILTCMNDVCGD